MTITQEIHNQMKKLLLSLALASLAAGVAVAQGPQPKSQEEINALIAVQNAADPNAKIEAGQTLLKDFKDTEFKAWTNLQMMIAAQRAQRL